MKCAIDRARRDLSGTIIGFVGTGIEANRFQKYSNPDLRYLTSKTFKITDEEHYKIPKKILFNVIIEIVASV